MSYDTRAEAHYTDGNTCYCLQCFSEHLRWVDCTQQATFVAQQNLFGQMHTCVLPRICLQFKTMRPTWYCYHQQDRPKGGLQSAAQWTLLWKKNPLAPHVEHIHDFEKLKDSTLLKDSPLCSQSSQIEPFVQIHQTVISCVMTLWA